MVGVVRDHILPIAYGTGSNGKSTILGALLNTFGPDYAMKATPDMFMVKKTDSHPTERARLFGMRIVIAIETEQGRRPNETMIKELTGGDRIAARRMREEFWEFDPSHTLCMATNHKPRIRGGDDGIWRRLILIPITVSVPNEKADKAMPDKLAAEAPGILAWCVRDSLEWPRQGLTAPTEVAEATSSYREEQDTVGQFLEECTTKGNRVKSSSLYARYKQWLEQRGETPLSTNSFGPAIEAKGIKKLPSNGTWILGIELTSDKPAEEARKEWPI